MNHRDRTLISGLLVALLGLCTQVSAAQPIAVTELRLHDGEAAARKASVIHAAEISGEFSFKIPVADPTQPVELPTGLKVSLRDAGKDVAQATTLSHVSGEKFATVVVKPASPNKIRARVRYDLGIPSEQTVWEDQLVAAPSEDNHELRRRMTFINPTAERLGDECKILLFDSHAKLGFASSLDKLGGPVDAGKTRTASRAYRTHLDWDTVQIDLNSVTPGLVDRHLTIDHKINVNGNATDSTEMIPAGALLIQGSPDSQAGLPDSSAKDVPDALVPYLPTTEPLSSAAGVFAGLGPGNLTKIPIGQDADVSVLSSAAFTDQGRFPVAIDADSVISLAVETHVVQISSGRDDVPVRFLHSGAGRHVVEESWAEMKAGTIAPYIVKSIAVAPVDTPLAGTAAEQIKRLQASLNQLDELAFANDATNGLVPRTDRLYLFRTEPKIALSVAKESDPSDKLREYAVKLRNALKAKIVSLGQPPVVEPGAELKRERREIEKAIAEIQSSPNPDDFWREYRYLTGRHEYLAARIGDLQRTDLRNRLPLP